MARHQTPWDDELLDRLLDGGLERMKSGEPRAGLEARILARVAAARPRFDWYRWPLRLGVAFGAVDLITAAVYFTRPPFASQECADGARARLNRLGNHRQPRSAPSSAFGPRTDSRGQSQNDRPWLPRLGDLFLRQGKLRSLPQRPAAGGFPFTRAADRAGKNSDAAS